MNLDYALPGAPCRRRIKQAQGELKAKAGCCCRRFSAPRVVLRATPALHPHPLLTLSHSHIHLRRSMKHLRLHAAPALRGFQRCLCSRRPSNTMLPSAYCSPLMYRRRKWLSKRTCRMLRPSTSSSPPSCSSATATPASRWVRQLLGGCRETGCKAGGSRQGFACWAAGAVARRCLGIVYTCCGRPPALQPPPHTQTKKQSKYRHPFLPALHSAQRWQRSTLRPWGRRWRRRRRLQRRPTAAPRCSAAWSAWAIWQGAPTTAACLTVLQRILRSAPASPLPCVPGQPGAARTSHVLYFSPLSL
jgi:hypothetical protein